MPVRLESNEIVLGEYFLSTELFKITNKRLIYEDSTFPKLDTSFNLEKVTNVQVQWGLFRFKKSANCTVLDYSKILQLYGFSLALICCALLLLKPINLSFGIGILVIMYILQKLTIQKNPKLGIKFFFSRDKSILKEVVDKKLVYKLAELQAFVNDLIKNPYSSKNMLET